MKKQLVTPLILCVAILLQGCVSLATQHKTAFGSKECSFPLYTYGGTITSTGLLVMMAVEIPRKPTSAIFGATMLAVDFPFTVAMDTISLPLSVVRDIKACIKRYNGKKSPNSGPRNSAENQNVSLFLVRVDRPNELVMLNHYLDNNGV